jgi:hypothetical protein
MEISHIFEQPERSSVGAVSLIKVTESEREMSGSAEWK